MYQKLEDRLKLYEQDHPIKDDDGLIAAIESILNEQDSLPIEERDFNLIAEATDSILKLQGYRESDRATMAEEAASSVKARIAHQKGITSNGKLQNKHRSVLRWIIPLVAVLAITTIGVFASPTNRLAISDMTNRIFSELKAKTTLHEDNINLEITQDIVFYDSFRELSTAFKDTIMLPFDIEDELHNLSIEVADYGDSCGITILFDYEGLPYSFTISKQWHGNGEALLPDTRIGEFDVALSELNGNYIAEWLRGLDLYQVKAKSVDSLEPIIKHMRFLYE